MEIQCNPAYKMLDYIEQRVLEAWALVVFFDMRSGQVTDEVTLVPSTAVRRDLQNYFGA